MIMVAGTKLDICTSTKVMQAMAVGYGRSFGARACTAVLASQTHCKRTCMMHMQEASERGPRQTIHVLVTTYTEPVDMVREGVLRLLVAPEPVYTKKIIYLCDDGYSGPEGPRKRAVVDELRGLGAHAPDQQACTHVAIAQCSMRVAQIQLYNAVHMVMVLSLLHLSISRIDQSMNLTFRY